jgi:Fe-S oxidoreductase
MKKSLTSPEDIKKAHQLDKTKKPQTCEKQRLYVRFHVENPITDGRPQRFLEAFAAILKHSNYGAVLDHYIRSSMKCARCTSECFIYQATGDPRDIPCHRSTLILDVYRRHFTLGGRLKGGLLGRGHLTDEMIQEMSESVWNCTACRKCMLECPAGIDHGLVTHLTRTILAEIGIAPRALVVSTREQLEGQTGNTSGFPLPSIIDGLEFLEEEILEEKGVAVKFPLDVEDVDYVFFPAVSDFMMEADTLMGNAVVMHATGAKWTIGTKYHDGINYGLFYSDRLWDRVVSKVDAETRRLHGKNIMIGECGHATRSAKEGIPMFCGGRDALPVINCIEYAYQMYQAGKLKLDPNVVTERVTYHDPCNIARKGQIIEPPRNLLRAFCKNFVEMTPNRTENICCGGGGGTVSIDEIRPYRTLISGKAKAEQIRATGAKYVVAPCANCKKQLREVVEDQGLDCEIVGLHDLLYKAIILEKPAANESAAPDAEATEVAR